MLTNSLLSCISRTETDDKLVSLNSVYECDSENLLPFSAFDYGRSPSGMVSGMWFVAHNWFLKVDHNTQKGGKSVSRHRQSGEHNIT